MTSLCTKYLAIWGFLLGFPGGSAGKESACKVGDLGSIPALGRSPEERNGYPLQYSGLENSMDYIVHGVTKSWTRLSSFHCHWLMMCLHIREICKFRNAFLQQKSPSSVLCLICLSQFYFVYLFLLSSYYRSSMKPSTLHVIFQCKIFYKKFFVNTIYISTFYENLLKFQLKLEKKKKQT